MTEDSNETSHSSAAEEPAARNPVFATTHWSVVLTAGRCDTTRAHSALESLCRVYWYPLYSYARRRGHGPEDAADLTQEFFARLLQNNWVANADQSKGRFRSFLLMAMNRFLINEWAKARTQKRGGQYQLVPFDALTAERRFAREPADPDTPERQYEKQWALTLLDEVLDRLAAEYTEQGKAEWFEVLRPCLMGSGESQPYEALSQRLAMSENAIRVAVSRLRQRYRERLKEEIAHSLAAAEDVDEEMRHLVRVLSRR